jgi:hypothetical protein
MSNLAFVEACYYELYGPGPAPTKATVQSHFAVAVHCHDYDDGFDGGPTGVVHCLDHMTRPNAGSCVDRVTVVVESGQQKISDIEICYLESP